MKHPHLCDSLNPTRLIICSFGVTMSFMEMLDNLRETQWVEFKEATFELPKDVWESYSAMANTEGGEIILGVRENSSGKFIIEGVLDSDKIISEFWNTVRNPEKINHDIMLFDGVYSATLNNKTVVIIKVPRSERDKKPVSVYDRKSRKFIAWIRKGAGDYKANEDDLRQMSYDSIPGADRKPLDRFDISSLCDETIARYRSVFASVKPNNPWNTDSKEDFLYHIGALAKGVGGNLHPTQAGLLAFGYEYEITNYLPQFLLDYREELSENNRWDDRVVSQSGDWSGNLIDFYYLLTNRLLKHFRSPFSTDEKGMLHGSNNLITESVNEVIVNALVHAYYGASSSIRILLHKDNLFVYNPGTLLVDKDIAISGGFSEARNPTLMRIFSFIGASDRAGSGLSMVFKTWNEFFNSHPKIEEGHAPSQVCFTLPIYEQNNETQNKTLRPRATLNVQETLNLLYANPSGLTSNDISKLTGVPTRTIQRNLKKLYDEKKVSRIKQGHYFRYMI